MSKFKISANVAQTDEDQALGPSLLLQTCITERGPCSHVCSQHRPTMPLLPPQVLLLLVALVAVPWMLIPKPYILKKRHEARQSQVPCSQH